MNFIVLISFQIGLSLSKLWLWFPFDVNDTYLYTRVVLQEFLLNGICINRVNGTAFLHIMKTYFSMQYSDFNAYLQWHYLTLRQLLHGIELNKTNYTLRVLN